MKHNFLLMQIPAYRRMAEEYDSITNAAGNDSLSSFLERYADKKEDLDLLNNNYFLKAAMGSIYEKATGSRVKIYKAINDVRSFYLVETILSQMYEDALAPDISSGDIVTITSKNKAIKKELETLDRRFNFDALISDIVIDLIAYGEYKLRTKIEKGKGIVELFDDVDQTKVVTLYKNGENQGFLGPDLNSNSSRIAVQEYADYVAFTIKGNKLRVNLFDDFLRKRGLTEKEKNAIPSHVRIGKSMLYPVLNKIKELELLEQLIPATKLAKLSTGTLLGTQVPASVSPEEGFKIAKKIEGLINRKIAISDGDQLSMENIMSSAGKLKVVPVFGEKGTLQKFDYKMEEPDDLLNSTAEIRRIICSSMGIPHELLYGGDSSESKGEMLKRHARYLRKLKNIQGTLAEGLKELCYIHLTNLGISFENKDIEVSFRNKLVETDELQRIEYIDMTQAFLGNIKDFVVYLEEIEAVKDPINWDVFFRYIDTQLSVVGLHGLIKQNFKIVKEKDQGPETGIAGE